MESPTRWRSKRTKSGSKSGNKRSIAWRRHAPLIVTLIVIVVIAALGFAYATPYIALNNLKRAADARDAQTSQSVCRLPRVA